MTAPLSLGLDGPRLNPLAYGCWRFSQSTHQQADEKIRTALDCGITLIDTADIYGYGEPGGFGQAERVLGDLFKADPSLRQHMVLATKGGVDLPRPYNARATYLRDAIDASLARLQTDYVDLYYIHRPDVTAPVAETAAALDAMVTAGKVRAVGLSNHTPAQMRALQAHLGVPVVAAQPEFSVLHQEPLTDGTLDWCAEHRAVCMAWSPLAGGKIVSDDPADARATRVGAVLDRLAVEHETTRSAIALSFLMSLQTPVIPIIGTQSTARIQETAAKASLRLPARAVYDIIETFNGAPMP